MTANSYSSLTKANASVGDHGAAPSAIATLPVTATVDDIKEATDRDGAVIVQGVLSPDLLARIIADLEPYLDEINPKTDYDGDACGAFLPKTKRLEGLVDKSNAVVEAIRRSFRL